MKKVLFALLAVFMLFSFISCDEKVVNKATIGECTMPESFSMSIHVFESENPDDQYYVNFIKCEEGFACLIGDEGFSIQFSGESATYYEYEDGAFKPGVSIPSSMVSQFNERFANSAVAFFADEAYKTKELRQIKSNVPMCGELFMCNVYVVTEEDGDHEVAFDIETNMLVYYKGPEQLTGWDISTFETENVHLP